MSEYLSNEQKERLMRHFKRLGEVVNETLSASEEIQDMLGQIREFGFGVELTMLIGLGLSPSSRRSDKAKTSDLLSQETKEFILTQEDKLFLSSNGITIDAEYGSIQ